MAESEEVVDGTVADEPQEPVQAALAVREQPTLTVAPQAQAGDLVERLDAIKDAQQKAMIRGVDYGEVPGTNKPTLLKPGAEKLSVMFQLDVQLENEKRWEDGGHLTVMSRATVFHAPTGARLGFGEGMCSTREKKYAKRKQERTCPQCAVAAIIKGKQEYGGGWVCFKKKGGCGAKFPDGAQEIESQQVGEVENPDLPDTWNTVVKMAEKRARVDAVLAVTGASALFTQDVEDFAGASPEDGGAPPFGPEVPPAEKRAVGAAIVALVGQGGMDRVVKKVLDRAGYMPQVVADALLEAAAVRGEVPAPEPS